MSRRGGYIASAGRGKAIAVDASDNVYLTVNANANFPVTPGTPPSSAAEGIVKVGAGLRGIYYAMRFDATNVNFADALVADSAGDAFVTGTATSTTLQTSPGAAQPASGGGSDAVVVKINPYGTGFSYLTYLGGSSGDAGLAIALDPAGNAYVTGTSGSRDFPVRHPFLSGSLGCGGGAFVAEMNQSGGMVYSSFLGPGTPTGIAVDGTGAAYLTGTTGASSFPTVRPFQSAVAGAVNGFVT